MQLEFKIGQRLSFTTNSALYNDIYESEIVGIFPDRIELAIALHKGYLLLIPIGTQIKWLNPALENYCSETVSRTPAQQSWSVTIPKLIQRERKSRVIAVGSGKGGVGKTSFSINLALAFAKLGLRTVVLDADVGMANVEVLLKLNNAKNLTNVINGDCTLMDILTQGPGGIKVLPGSSGISSLTNLNALQFNRIFSGFVSLENQCDILIIDTGAGISELVLKFLESADNLLLITTTEPHAMMDTYSLTKALAYRNQEIQPNLIFNRCDSEHEAMKCYEIFHQASSKFLKLKPELLGWIIEDKRVTKSLKSQEPILLTNPTAEYSQQAFQIANRLLGNKVTLEKPTGIRSFINKIKKNFI